MVSVGTFMSSHSSHSYVCESGSDSHCGLSKLVKPCLFVSFMTLIRLLLLVSLTPDELDRLRGRGSASPPMQGISA